MKRALLASLILATVAIGSVQAAEPFQIPSFVSVLDGLDDAMSDAARANKGVTFLLMESGST